MIAETNDQIFQNEVTQSDLPIVIDFYAPWCSPCKIMAPIVEELAKEYKGKLVFLKANVDDCPDLVQQFNIMSIPATVFLKDGQEIDKVVGFHNKDILVKKINEIFKS